MIVFSIWWLRTSSPSTTGWTGLTHFWGKRWLATTTTRRSPSWPTWRLSSGSSTSRVWIFLRRLHPSLLYLATLTLPRVKEKICIWKYFYPKKRHTLAKEQNRGYPWLYLYRKVQVYLLCFNSCVLIPWLWFYTFYSTFMHNLTVINSVLDKFQKFILSGHYQLTPWKCRKTNIYLIGGTNTLI